MSMNPFLAPGAVILLLALGVWWTSRREKAHVDHPEFVRKFAKLPKVEGGTKKRF